MEICMQTLLLSLLLYLVLSVGNIMLPIMDLMVDGGCIATTGGRRLFCINIIHIKREYVNSVSICSIFIKYIRFTLCFLIS
jgi:hypothetical protein